MSQKNSQSSAAVNRNPSWGAACGLLAGCAVTLVGVCLDLSPLTILTRAAVSGLVVSFVASLVVGSWRLVSPLKEDD